MTKYNIPLVSICIPTYNSSSFIIKTLESVRLQNYINLEILIIDDYSTDKTREIVHDWILNNYQLNVMFLCNIYNRGVVETCADLLSLSNGEFFQFLGADDLIYYNKISKQVYEIKNLGHEYALVFCDVNIINEFDEVISQSYLKEQNLNIKQVFKLGVSLSLINKNFIPSPSVLIRTSHAKESGGINKQISFEDLDLYIRLSMNFKFGYIDEKLGSYRRLSNSLMHSSISYIKILEATLQCLNQYRYIKKWRKNINKKFTELVPAVYMSNHENGKTWVKVWFRKSFTIKSAIYLFFSLFNIKYSKN